MLCDFLNNPRILYNLPMVYGFFNLQHEKTIVYFCYTVLYLEFIYQQSTSKTCLVAVPKMWVYEQIKWMMHRELLLKELLATVICPHIGWGLLILTMPVNYRTCYLAGQRDRRHYRVCSSCLVLSCVLPGSAYITLNHVRGVLLVLVLGRVNINFKRLTQH